VPAANYVLGVDLGGSSVKAVAVTPQGETLATRRADFDADAHMAWGETIRAIQRELSSGLGQPDGIGVSAPGLAAQDQRSIAVMPGRLSGLEGLDWTAFLGSPGAVPVLNDAHAALLGECWLGAARGFRHVIMLTLGTGVGGAILSDGRLLRGASGKAGHLGHVCLDMQGAPDVCGMPGSLELAMGNCTIVEGTGARFESTHQLLAAHLAGEPEATRVWLRSIRALACAVASYANVLDPEAVILGGGIAQAGAALLQPLQGVLDAIEWRPGGRGVQLRPAILGEFAGAYGAASEVLRWRQPDL